MNMREQLFEIMKSMKELYDNGEAVVFNEDLTAIKNVLDEVGFVYREDPTNHSYTKIEIK